MRAATSWLIAGALLAAMDPTAHIGASGSARAATTSCACDAATSPPAFRACVRRAVRQLSKEERDAAAIRTLKRLAAKATCGRTTIVKKTVACCLPFTASQGIVHDRMCAAVKDTACTALGGSALAGAVACQPDPCAWTADDIPVAHTPAGGYGANFPAPILTGCTQPLVAGAPDLRGMWKVVGVEVDGAPAASDHPAYRHFERVEQCGDRLVVTAGGVVHDMRCDGTEANGVHDVAEFDFTTPIVVVATYEDMVHVLRPVGVPIEVTRRRDGEQMIWKYLSFTARLERVGDPDAPPPAR